METDHTLVDKQKIQSSSIKILTEIIKNVRNSQYLEKIGVSSLFNSYFDTETGAFDEAKTEHFLNDFKEKIPLSEYSDYEELIDKIYSNGEENILFPGLPHMFTISSGTTSGKSKVFPFTFQFFKSWTFPPESLIQYFHKQGFKHYNSDSKGIVLNTCLIKAYSPGKNIPVCTLSSAIEFKKIDIEPSIVKSDTNYRNRLLKGIIYSLSYKDLEFIYCIFLSTMADYFSLLEQNFDLIMDHIENGTLPTAIEENENNFLPGKKESLENLKPNKARADEIRLICKDNMGNINIKNKFKEIWPKFVVVFGVSSGSFEPYLNICRSYWPDVIYLNTGYSSSEGLHANSVPILNNAYMTNLPDRSFLEFIPENSNEILTSDQLEINKYYEIVITSDATGLIRYRMGDIIKTVGWFNNMPVFSIIGRKDLSLRINLYQIREQEFIDSFNQLNINAMYAFFVDKQKHPTCFGLFVECDSKLIDKEVISKKIDLYLKETNENYRLASSKAEKSMPISIYFVQPDSFMSLNVFKAKKLEINSVTQIKPIKIIFNDDEIDFLLQRLI